MNSPTPDTGHFLQLLRSVFLRHGSCGRVTGQLWQSYRLEQLRSTTDEDSRGTSSRRAEHHVDWRGGGLGCLRKELVTSITFVKKQHHVMFTASLTVWRQSRK